MIGYINEQTSNQRSCSCSRCSFGFIFLCITQPILGVLSCLFPQFTAMTINYTFYTINYYNVWRPFTAIFSPIIQKLSVINLGFALLVLSQFAPALEKKYSTIYFLTEIYLQNLLFQLVVTLIAFILYQVEIGDSRLIEIGLWPLVLIYSWKSVAENPQIPSTFCCFPCLMPYKYIPTLFLIVLIYFQYTWPLLIIAYGLGYLQSMVLKRTIFCLPLKFYKTAEKIFLPCFGNFKSFVKVDSVQQNLKPLCCVGSNQNRQAEQRHENGVVHGEGIILTGSSNNFAASQGYNNFQEEVVESNLQRQKQVTEQRPKLDSDDYTVPKDKIQEQKEGTEKTEEGK